jgi:hypothetical protein
MGRSFVLVMLWSGNVLHRRRWWYLVACRWMGLTRSPRSRSRRTCCRRSQIRPSCTRHPRLSARRSCWSDLSSGIGWSAAASASSWHTHHTPHTTHHTPHTSARRRVLAPQLDLEEPRQGRRYRPVVVVVHSLVGLWGGEWGCFSIFLRLIFDSLRCCLGFA